MGSSDIDLPLPEFLDAVADRTPAPGGGSVAAVAAASAAALVEMAARFAHEWDGADEASERARTLRTALLQMAADDARVVPKMVHPDNAAEEAAARELATAIPLRIAQAAAEVMELASHAKVQGNPNLAPDAEAARLVANAAAEAARELIRANKGGEGTTRDPEGE